MIEAKKFFEELLKKNFKSYIGVPDSLLKYFCAYVQDNAENHIIANNEGTALALAAGQYLKTKSPSIVYLQNSGFGNLINPVLSLNDREVYALPVLLLIGWRGEPGINDEPQHIKQGRIMEPLLKTIGLEYTLMDKNSSLSSIVSNAYDFIRKNKKPYAILIKKNTFDKYLLKNKSDESFYHDHPKREKILKNLIELFDKKTHFITTTGVCSRELFELRENLKQEHSRDLLTVGSMGHVLAIAQGICSIEKNKRIVCIDGDGSVLMHLGSLSLNHNINAKNLVHIMINNGAHDSVGGQPTIAKKINFMLLAESLGYKYFFSSKSIVELKRSYKKIQNLNGPIFWEIFSSKGFRKDLARPTIPPINNVKDFMKNL